MAKQLDRAFDDVGRCGMVFEGYALTMYAKLIRCTAPRRWNSGGRSNRPRRKFFARYEGYISSHDAARADDEQLAALAARIRHAPFKARTINAGH